MILGNPYQDTQSTFELDTLKKLPQFFNYLFVYIPNRGKNATEKLKCIDALSRLITFGFLYGHSNLFLQINDPTITQSDIANSNLNSIFKSIRLNNIKQGTTPNTTTVYNDITSDFKESIIANDSVKDDKDETGVFYYENNDSNSGDSTRNS